MLNIYSTILVLNRIISYAFRKAGGGSISDNERHNMGTIMQSSLFFTVSVLLAYEGPLLDI